MADEMNAYRDLVRTIRNIGESGEGQSFAPGVVVSAQDGALLVQLDGVPEPTPATATTCSISVGDAVTVLLSDDAATIVGNVTSPATDDAKAKEAMDAVEDVKEHFWYDDSGAHVEGREYRNDLTSKGMAIVDKLSGAVLARFAKDLIELGNNSAKAVISLLGGLGRIELNSGREHPWLKVSAQYLYLQGQKRTRIGNVYGTTTVYNLFQREEAEASISNVSSGDYGTVEIEIPGESREYICVQEVYFDSRAFALLGWSITGQGSALGAVKLNINYRNVGSSKYSTKVHAILVYQDTSGD